MLESPPARAEALAARLDHKERQDAAAQRVVRAHANERLPHAEDKHQMVNIITPRALATSGRRPGVRAKRAARGVAGRQIWTGRREKTAHPSIAIILRCR